MPSGLPPSALPHGGMEFLKFLVDRAHLPFKQWYTPFGVSNCRIAFLNFSDVRARAIVHSGSFRSFLAQFIHIRACAPEQILLSLTL